MTDHATETTHARPYDDHLAIRRIEVADVFTALRRGFDDFTAMPTHLIFLVLVYPVIGLVIGYATAQDDLIPLFYPLVAGFALLGPVATVGLAEISRRRERGEDVTWRDAFRVFRSPALPAIVELASILTILFLGWLIAADLIFRATMGSVAFDDFGSFLRAIVARPEGWTLIVVGNLVGFLFAAAAFTLSAVSFPVLLDRKASLATAVSTSVAAVIANPIPMAVWALTIAVLLFAGAACLMVGLVVVLPILGHATWHMYRMVVVDPDAPVRHASVA
jgi:uncharacterized membrane protein